MAEDSAEAAAVAAASASIHNLHSMSMQLNDLFEDGSEQQSRHEWWDEPDEEDESEAERRTRESRPRPDYNKSAWGLRLAEMESLRSSHNLHQHSRQAKAFRSDFRVPYEFFLAFVTMVRPVFPSRVHDIAGRLCVPLELKVLGVLQVLGRGNCFADVANFSLMSRATAEKSFHRFCDCFSAGLWHTWVKLPEGEDLKRVEGIYSMLGCSGAVDSVDCTHVPWERCYFSETQTHKGKEGYTTLVYEAICDHAGRILASTKGYPGAENDKTIVKRDLSMLRIDQEEPWASYKYNLCDVNGNVTEHTGGWLIADGGYHRVPLLICPFKLYASKEQQEWSKRFESVRKDIECLFGRLKGRFRLFKTGILFGTRGKIDNAWFTACIIHNMLHQFDGLANLEVDMDWEGKDGEADSTTGAFPVSAETKAGGVDDDGCCNGAFQEHRRRLVEHFAYKKSRNEVSWVRAERAN